MIEQVDGRNLLYKVNQKLEAWDKRADNLSGDLILYNENVANWRLELAKQLGLETTQVTDKYATSLYRKWKKAERKGSMGGFDTSADVKTALGGFITAQKSLHSAEGVLKRYSSEKDKLEEWAYFINKGEWFSQELGTKYLEKATFRKKKDSLTRELLTFYNSGVSRAAVPENSGDGEQSSVEPQVPAENGFGDIVEGEFEIPAAEVHEVVDTLARSRSVQELRGATDFHAPSDRRDGANRVLPDNVSLEAGVWSITGDQEGVPVAQEQALVSLAERTLVNAPEGRARGLLNRMNPLSVIKRVASEVNLSLPKIEIPRPRTKLGYATSGMAMLGVVALAVAALNSCSVKPNTDSINRSDEGERKLVVDPKATERVGLGKTVEPHTGGVIAMDPKAKEQVGITVSSNVVDSLGTGIKTPSGVEIADLRRPRVISEMARQLGCLDYDFYAQPQYDWDPRVMCKLSERTGHNRGARHKTKDGTIEIGNPPVNVEKLKKATGGRVDPYNIMDDMLRDPAIATGYAYLVYSKEGYAAFEDCTNGNVDCGISIKSSTKKSQGG